MLDAVSGGLHETFHSYLKGADDVIFNIGQALGEGCKYLAHAFTSNLDSYEFTLSKMNYMEFIRETAKKGEYNSTSTADAITVSSSGVSIYAQDGDDYIENYFSNVTILAGHGNDNDYLYSYDSGNTLYGNKGDDHLVISGNKNVIFGNEGGDIFFVQGDSNSVSSGASTKPGTGGLIVKDAKDLKININTIELEEGETLPEDTGGALITNPYDNAIILMPGLWGTEKALRGTAGDDYIENTLDNIMIYGLGGDDTIINHGKYVTINAGDGADTVDNAGNNSLIDGGNDMDSIKNSGESVTISAGSGNDTVFAGDGDSINAGAGDNQITVNSSMTNGAIYALGRRRQEHHYH